MSGHFVRKYPRYDVDLSVLFRLIGQFEWQSAMLMNLSKGGLCMVSPQKIGAGQFVELEFHSNDKTGAPNKRRFVAKVCWVRGNYYGLEFSSNGRRGTMVNGDKAKRKRSRGPLK